MYTEKELTWTIVDKKLETPGVYSLLLESKENQPSFKAGQYLTIKIPNLGPTEGKAYSIASSPSENSIRIAVREIGEFSRAITKLSAGDSIITSLPYGFFYPEVDDTTNLVFVAGGIGITPCMSIIKHLCETGDKRNIHLLYSNQTEKDIVFFEELLNIEKKYSTFTANYFITRETPTGKNFHNGRMSPENIMEYITDTSESEFFICGSMDFTKDMFIGLKNNGIKQVQIYTEGFF